MPTLEQMKIRQSVLANFGDFALRCDDLDDVLHEACRLVSDALGTDLARVLEIEEGGAAAFVKAAIGWRRGIVGQERLPFFRAVFGDLLAESPRAGRFARHPRRRQVRVRRLPDRARRRVPGERSFFLPGGEAYGLLQVDSRELRDFGEEEIAFLRVYATILGPVIDRVHKLHSLEQALETNERLFRELQHRVKNHIGIITSMVRVRARHV